MHSSTSPISVEDETIASGSTTIPAVDERPRWTRNYQHALLDGHRWKAYRPRDDDILVCTAYKAGTTWMQNICALLVFQTTEFPAPLSAISPWLEVPRVPTDDLMAALEAQTHRRIVKTHTPLDGIPYHDSPSYIFIGRDPRDVFMSMLGHIANTKPGSRLATGAPSWPRDEIPADPRAFFRKWITTPGIPWERDGWPSWSVLSHALTFWRHRGRSNVHLFHYADLKADLDGQMRRVSALLDIPIDEAQWPRLVEAARFESMKRNAERTVAGGNWRDPAAFFAKGEHGQWRGVLGGEELALYRAALRERLPPDLADWLENGGAGKSARLAAVPLEPGGGKAMPR